MSDCSYTFSGETVMEPAVEERKSDIFAALAHPNRIRIVEFIRNGVKCNCEIAPALDLEQSNLSRHLKMLVQEGILCSWKEGLRVNYKISDPRVFTMLDLAEVVARTDSPILNEERNALTR
ncbi:MAG: metalloregulator ArsR/SmtB family transcription factor [Bacteroidota bacterium]